MNNVTCDANISTLNKSAFIFVILLFLMMIYNYACAACPSRTTSTGTVNFGTLTVTPISVGGLIASKPVYIGSGNILNINGDVYFNLTKFTTLSSLGNGIYDTNIPGVGIKIYYYSTPFPDQQTYTGDGIKQPATYLVELYKTTSSVQSGIITAGQIATLSCGGPGANIYNAINISAINIVSTACTVDTSSITVPLGNVYSSAFSTVGSTSNETTFTIPLTCPSAGVKVKMQLDGNTVSGSTTALVLSNSGSNGVASGYGVQVITGSSPIVIGTPTQVTTSTVGQINVPLKARYIKTSANSSSGTANSTATFTMSYE
ncbi:hypothetical protein H8I69_21390 [Serratia fonticola]|uniref:fimbrial protein n=1 Tax=Serratia fonticola TaxID=47917 RepID=UPI0015C59503|nr:fimbrial protein [Serratia fonticola]MBC3381672.1 hypothetical protein [Serratia fonticola]NYA40871.1 hypothetical protein [Serratia fonticola]